MERNLSPKLYLAILATGLMAFCGIVIETAMNVTFPTLMNQFNVGTGTIQWLTTGYLLIVSIVIPLSGYLKRRFTNKRLFISSSITFIIGLLICSFANSFPLLLAGRLIQGCGTGVALPLMFNIILEQAPLNKIGFLMGIGTLVTAVAPALGPTYGGLLVDKDWHLIFIFLLIIMVFAVIIGSISITQVTKTERISLDVLSWLSISIFFVGAILAFNSIENSVISSLAFGLIGIFGLIAFVFRTKRVDSPLINGDIFKIPSFSLLLIGFIIFQMILVGVAFILPNYLQIVNGISSGVAGLLLLPGAALGAVLSPLSGKLYDSLGPKKPINLGLLLQAIALVLFITTALSSKPWQSTLGYILLMLGTGFAMGNIMTSGLSQASKELSADANAVFNTLQQFAGALGTAVASLIIALFQTNSNLAGSTALGARVDFLVLACLLIIAAFAINLGLSKSTANK
ncbi:DHA2 family efflux MFS transporter permease subunit [Lentilactobacillus sp. Marseille-Q4993]|uniref:DHA2 family efflux MFS transporter permease subunit n=1 Tax=Lentilactobacillus sp. Marseille-Q4993 TaxID=3039492 RepID=UPI0024BC806B|nr:DHA2 family efflux MFS transporter permease subunit [Lentilactobacillus sp. Marseille-Q4993]